MEFSGSGLARLAARPDFCTEAGLFDAETAPLTTPEGRLVTRDESVRPATTPEILAGRGQSAEVENRVRVMLDKALKTYSPADLVGISCIADGPDTWFADLVRKRGGHPEVVLPAEEFRDGLPGWHHLPGRLSTE